MCPSFRVTGEEQHSTRGRAHLLWEMTKGEVIRDGWRDEHVKESLDLCLACKGCKSDCPVGVDVATYKAEFLSHYYEGRRRPRSAYAFGNIATWARLASIAPGLVNLATQTPLLRELAKIVAGMPPQRSIPAFARETFRAWFRRRQPAESRQDRRSCSGRTRSITTSCLRPAKLRLKSWKRRGFRCSCPRPACAAGAHSMTGACWSAPSVCSRTFWTRSRRKLRRELRWWFWSRVARRCSATS